MWFQLRLDAGRLVARLTHPPSLVDGRVAANGVEADDALAIA
jgi:hypothetical protein